MYWRRLTGRQRFLGVGVVVVALVGLGLLESSEDDAPENEGTRAAEAEGAEDEDGGGFFAGLVEAIGADQGDLEAPAASLAFQDWRHGSGLFGTEVPRGWRIDGALGDAAAGLDQGQFRINAYSPDGRSLISFGHNWLSYPEFQYGPYQPGTATIERFILPGFVQEQGAVESRIVYRSPNRRLEMPSAIGLGIPFDSGTLGFLLRTPAGGYTAGTVFGETMYIASPGTPGLWRLRLFAAAVAPADPQAQADVRAALDRAVGRLDLSGEFFQLWNQAFTHTQQQMREYSAQMDRVFTSYLRSAARSSDAVGGSGRDTNEDWATMMRGGQYGENAETGEQYWISNDRDYWWVNDQGVVAGTDTGDPPTYSANWNPLPPIGQ